MPKDIIRTLLALEGEANEQVGRVGELDLSGEPALYDEALDLVRTSQLRALEAAANDQVGRVGELDLSGEPELYSGALDLLRNSRLRALEAKAKETVDSVKGDPGPLNQRPSNRLAVYAGRIAAGIAALGACLGLSWGLLSVLGSQGKDRRDDALWVDHNSNVYANPSIQWPLGSREFDHGKPPPRKSTIPHLRAHRKFVPPASTKDRLTVDVIPHDVLPEPPLLTPLLSAPESPSFLRYGDSALIVSDGVLNSSLARVDRRVDPPALSPSSTRDIWQPGRQGPKLIWRSDSGTTEGKTQNGVPLVVPAMLVSMAVAVPASVGPAPAYGNLNDTHLDIVNKYLDATRRQQEALRGGQIEVDIDASIPKLQKPGILLQALKSVSKLGQITYHLLGFSGDNSVRTEVIARYLTAEIAAAENGSSVSVTPDHYKFKYKGIADFHGRQAYVLRVTPREKKVGLFKGELWLDAETYMPVRESGSFVKSPSVFLKKMQFVREYELQDGVAIPKHIESTVETASNRAELSIDFSNFTSQSKQRN